MIMKGCSVFLKAICIALLCLVCAGTVAQGSAAGGTVGQTCTISGRVIHNAGGGRKVVSVCSITAVEEKGPGIYKAVTREDGTFSLKLPSGRYRLLLESTGHKSRTLKVDVKVKDLSLGDVLLQIGEEIKAASIESETLVKREGTRISYDVLKDPDAAKINMTDMISRIPELKLSSRSGNLEYDNKAFDKILINESEHGLINAGRQYPMEFIKANYMRKIEVVLPGDLEYNNDKPILLITLARELPFGFASNLSMSSDTKNNHSPKADAVINTPWIGVGLSYGFNYSGPPSLKNETSRTVTEDLSDVSEINSSTQNSSESGSHNIGANFFRTFAKNTIRFNASLKGSFSESENLGLSKTEIIKSDGTSTLTENTVKSNSVSPFRLGGGLKLNGTFGKANRGGRNPHRWNVAYTFSNVQTDGVDEYSDYTYTKFTSRLEHRLNAQLNLKGPLKTPLLSSAAVWAGFYDRHFNNRSAGPVDSDGLDYRQRVAYFNLIALGSAFKRRFGYTVHLDGEYLSNEGSFLNGEVSSPLDYSSFNLMPVVMLAGHFDHIKVGGSFSRRVSRPNVQQLNPYQDRTNPYNIVTGNPELKGEITDAAGIHLSTVQKTGNEPFLFIAANCYQTEDKISRIVSSNPDGVSVTSYANLGSSTAIEFVGEFNWHISRKFGTSLSAKYSKTKAVLPSGFENTYDNLSLSLGLSWNPEWFDLHCFLQARPSLASVQSSKLILEPYGQIELSRYFKKPHIGVALVVTDVLHSGGLKRSEIVGENFIQTNLQERIGRTFSARVYWRFGKFRQIESVEVKAYDM